MECNFDKPALRYGKKIKLDLTQRESVNSYTAGKYKSKGRAKLADKATKEHSNCGSLAEPVQLRAVLHDKYYRPLETGMLYNACFASCFSPSEDY